MKISRSPHLAVGLACLFVVFATFGPVPRIAAEDETFTSAELDRIKELGRAAIEELTTTFSEEFHDAPVSRAAVLPVQRDIDQGYFTLQVENAFSRLGKQVNLEVYTRADEPLAAVLEEIGWNEGFVDAIDPSTVQKLGRLRGADAVVFTRVDVSRLDGGGFSVRAICQVKEVETARNLWGGEIVHRDEPPLSREQLISYAKMAGILLVVIAVWFRIRSSLRKARRPR
jgi:hypothetical protein